MKRTVLVIVLGALAITLGVHPDAHAQRFVVVNGRVMSRQNLAALDRAACLYVPDGYYWLDTGTGVWGYAGNPVPQGHLSDGCRQARRPSLSERRMLYTPYDHAK
jgi:hypothetical protein